MDKTSNPGTRSALRNAALLAGLATLVTAIAGMVLYLAASVILGRGAAMMPMAQPSMPGGLLGYGPMGYAAWMALLMACGSPLVGLGVFAILYLGRSKAG